MQVMQIDFQQTMKLAWCAVWTDCQCGMKDYGRDLVRRHFNQEAKEQIGQAFSFICDEYEENNEE
jgi:hypothetical protein